MMNVKVLRSAQLAEFQLVLLIRAAHNAPPLVFSPLIAVHSRYLCQERANRDDFGVYRCRITKGRFRRTTYVD